MILILLDRDNGCLPESKRGVILSTIYSNCPRSDCLKSLMIWNIMQCHDDNNTYQRIIGENSLSLTFIFAIISHQRDGDQLLMLIID